MSGLATRPRAGFVAVGLLVCLLASAVLAPLAGAVGPTLALTVSPPRATGTPAPGSDGAVNFSGKVDLYTDPLTQATIAVTIASQLGWSVSPSSFTFPTSTAGSWTFDFTVAVPATVIADTTDSLTATAAYRVGGVTTASESATVYAIAGEYRVGSIRRLSAPEPMAVGKTYLIEHDVRNEGNAGTTFTFAWADPDLNSRLKANFELPPAASLAGFNNTTLAFRITPQGTSPAGKHSVPVRMTLTDRYDRVFQTVNFTVEVEFSNLPIFPGILPRFELQLFWQVAGLVLILLVIWFFLNAGIAALKYRKLGPEDEAPYSAVLSRRLRRSLVGRAAGGVWRRLRGRLRRRRAHVEEA